MQSTTAAINNNSFLSFFMSFWKELGEALRVWSYNTDGRQWAYLCSTDIGGFSLEFPYLRLAV